MNREVEVKDLKDEQTSLHKAYLLAEEDPDRKEVIEDWSTLENKKISSS